MTETLTKSDFPEHFEVHHDNNEALMCMSSGGECRVLVEVRSGEFGYTPDEERELLKASAAALEAIDELTNGRAADLFAGLRIVIGEDLADGGAVAQAEDNVVLVNGRKTLISLDKMKEVSGAYDETELTGFPDEEQERGGLTYALVHEIGHILDGRTRSGVPYERVDQKESPTRYGREPDARGSDKRHEAFAEGFAHIAWGMPVSDAMRNVVQDTIQARLEEYQSSQPEGSETAAGVRLVDMSSDQLEDWLHQRNIHNGSHFMSSVDNERYQDLCETDLKEAIRFLREKWDEYADHEYIQSFALVHWVANSESGISDLERLLGDSRHEVEISTQGYRDDKSFFDNPRWLKAKFGVLIDGRVNLASNEDIQTNQWHGLLKDDDVKRRKYTEWANRLMTNESNCVSPYEFVVGDWKAAGIVIDTSSPHATELAELARRYDVPVIDIRQHKLFTETLDQIKNPAQVS